MLIFFVFVRSVLSHDYPGVADTALVLVSIGLWSWFCPLVSSTPSAGRLALAQDQGCAFVFYGCKNAGVVVLSERTFQHTWPIKAHEICGRYLFSPLQQDGI